MKKLNKKLAYEIVDDEVIVYAVENGKPVFDIPLTLSEMFCANAFSIQMLPEAGADVRIERIEEKAGMEIAPYIRSAVGHPDTAAVLGVECNRAAIALEEGDLMLVAQLVGGRLPEGATTLPEGYSFRFYLVDVLEVFE